MLEYAEQKANANLMYKLTQHVQYLASDSLEGRRTGTKGEQLAMQYIAQQYTAMGIEPKGTNGYIQEFEINEGKSVKENTLLKVNGKTLSLNTDFYPLAFSKNVAIKGSPAMALREKGQPWFLDVKDELEANKTNPHFDVEEFIKKQIDEVTKKGAIALFLYN